MRLTPENAKDGLTIRKVGDISQLRKLRWSQEFGGWFHRSGDNWFHLLDGRMCEWRIVEPPAAGRECHTCLYEGSMITDVPCRECCILSNKEKFTKWEPQPPAQPSGSLDPESVFVQRNAEGLPIVHVGSIDPKFLPIGHPDTSSTILEGFRVFTEEGIRKSEEIVGYSEGKVNGADAAEIHELAGELLYTFQRMQEILGDSGEANHGEKMSTVVDWLQSEGVEVKKVHITGETNGG